MKKISIILSIILIISFLSGWISYFLFDKNTRALYTNQDRASITEDKSFNPSTIKQIIINTEKNNVRILKSYNKDILVRFSNPNSQDNSHSLLKTEQIGNNLTVTIGSNKNKHNSPFKIFNFSTDLNNYNSLSLEVFIPQDFKDNIVVNTITGGCSIVNIEVNNFSFITGSGLLKVSNVISNNFNVYNKTSSSQIINFTGVLKYVSDSGCLKIQDIETPDTFIKTNNGLVEIVNFDGNLTYTSASGSLTIINNVIVNNSTYYIKTESGFIKLFLPQNTLFNLIYNTATGKLTNEFFSGNHDSNFNIKIDSDSGFTKIIKGLP